MKLDYQFYNLPSCVFENTHLSAYAKLTLMYLIQRESYYVEKKSIPKGSFIYTTLKAIASKIGKSKESVRKSYIPELIKNGVIDKKNVGSNADGNISTKCYYKILWDNILNMKSGGEEIDCDYLGDDNDKPF